MKIDIDEFRVGEHDKVKLDKWPTQIAAYYKSKAHYEQLLSEHVDKLRELQPMLYAHDRYAVLIIFQAMDAAGKDSAIKHVMSGVNPQGCVVYSFKQPGPEALARDFLWQARRLTPERGCIGIFNRSYYEEVLVVRVHPELLQAEKLPDEVIDDDRMWESRYRSINALERHLLDNGTRIIKFFLHLSKEEQRKRFLARLDEPEKNWKFSAADIKERAAWDDYMNAYAKCLSETSTKAAPWYVIPADDKRNARLIISKVIIKTLKSLPLSYPKLDPARREELEHLRRQLQAEGEQSEDR